MGTDAKLKALPDYTPGLILGRTTPPETTNLIASSTDIPLSCTSSALNHRAKPDVGFGIVGIYTTTYGSPSRFCSAVTKPMALMPVRGHSTNTARRYEAPPFGTDMTKRYNIDRESLKILSYPLTPSLSAEIY
jgi:hypothetical protein